MKECCRICARELCGNQRRWIFHPSSKLNLQLLLSHVLGRDLSRDGRGEFACSKCAFMLDRMYRFDTVIARVEALSLERLHKLLLEKNQLRQCIERLYRKNNSEEGADEADNLDSQAQQDVKYSELIQEDLAFSVYEAWAEKEEEEAAILDQQLQVHFHNNCPGLEAGNKTRRCKGCATLRVKDSDYEAVCKVPRKLGRRSTSCGPHTRYSGSEDMAESTPDDTTKCQSPNVFEESLENVAEVGKEPEEAPETRNFPENVSPEESARPGLQAALGVSKGLGVPMVKTYKGSKLPILVKTRAEQQEVRSYQQEVTLQEMEGEWNDEYLQCGPFRFQQRVMEEQSDQLIHYETAAAQCLTELQTAQNQVQTLQSKIQLSEDRNQRLQRRLTELELELRSVQEEAQEQERNLQNVTDSLCSRDSEAAELYRVIEEQNKMLCSLKETTHSHTQVSSGEEVSFQSELLSLQLALFRSQLDLEALDRVQRNKDRTEADLRRSVERLKQDLQGALQQSRDTREHNQELQSDLDQTRAALRDREDELKKVQTQNQRQNQVKNRTISELKAALGRKEQLIQDYSQLLDSKENQDSVIFKLRKSIEKRDQALERVVEEQLQRLQQEEQEKLQLQELLRDKQNDLQTQTQVLLHNQDTIKTLEVLVRGRTLELERLSESLRKSGLKQNQVQTELNRIIAEKDGLIRTLQTGLREFTQEAQELRQAHASLCPSNVLQQLQLRLQLKDRLLQEVMSDRTRQTQDQLEQVQELVRTLDLRDQYIQDSSPRFLELLKEQSDRIKDLRKNLLSPGLRPDQDQVWTLKDQLRQALKRDQENQDQVRQVQRDLEEKDQVIKKLVAELQDLRGGLRADAAPEQSLVLGLERAEGGVESGGGAHSQSIMGHSSLM